MMADVSAAVSACAGGAAGCAAAISANERDGGIDAADLADYIFALCQQLQSAGLHLEHTNKGELNRTFAALRQACCRDNANELGAACRRRVMELIELRAMGWRPRLAHTQYYLSRNSNTENSYSNSDYGNNSYRNSDYSSNDYSNNDYGSNSYSNHNNDSSVNNKNGVCCNNNGNNNNGTNGKLYEAVGENVKRKSQNGSNGQGPVENSMHNYGKSINNSSNNKIDNFAEKYNNNNNNINNCVPNNNENNNKGNNNNCTEPKALYSIPPPPLRSVPPPTGPVGPPAAMFLPPPPLPRQFDGSAGTNPAVGTPAGGYFVIPATGSWTTTAAQMMSAAAAAAAAAATAPYLPAGPPPPSLMSTPPPPLALFGAKAAQHTATLASQPPINLSTISGILNSKSIKSQQFREELVIRNSDSGKRCERAGSASCHPNFRDGLLFGNAVYAKRKKNHYFGDLDNAIREAAFRGVIVDMLISYWHYSQGTMEAYLRSLMQLKLMGVKGRRVALIEEISGTVISFQKVESKCKERVLTITGSTPNSIRDAKRLIDETIRRNVSPTPAGHSTTSTDSNSSTPTKSATMEAGPKSGACSKPTPSKEDEPDPAIGHIYIQTSADGSLRLCCDDPNVLEAAQAALSEYLNRVRLNADDGTARKESPRSQIATEPGPGGGSITPAPSKGSVEEAKETAGSLGALPRRRYTRDEMLALVNGAGAPAEIPREIRRDA